MMSQWDNLGDIDPGHYDPSGIDPMSLRNLDNPQQPAGPVPYHYQTGANDNGAGMAGMGQQQAAQPAKPTVASEAIKGAGDVISSGIKAYGDYFGAAKGMEMRERQRALQAQLESPPPVLPTGGGPYVPGAGASRLSISKKALVGLAVVGVAIVGVGLYMVMRRKRRRR